MIQPCDICRHNKHETPSKAIACGHSATCVNFIRFKLKEPEPDTPFKVGPARMRDGHEVHILAYHPEQSYSLLGEVYVDDHIQWASGAWRKNGQWLCGEQTHAHDLVPPKAAPKRGTVVDIGNGALRVSTGKLAEDGQLIAYHDYGNFKDKFRIKSWKETTGFIDIDKWKKEVDNGEA